MRGGGGLLNDDGKNSDVRSESSPMKQQQTKIKKWHLLGIGITILGLGIWVSQASTALKAETEAGVTQDKKAATEDKVIQISSSLNPKLPMVTNEQGLQATPKVVTITQNSQFPTAGTSQKEVAKLITGLTIPTPSSGIDWEYVDSTGAIIEPSSAAVGFQTIYVKITEKNGSSSIQVPIPVSVTDSNTTAVLTNQAMIKADAQIILYPDEIKDKTNEELHALIQAKANLSAWDMSNGSELSASVSETKITNDKIGDYTATFTVDLNGESATTTRTVTIFGATLKSPSSISVAQNETLDMGKNASSIFANYQTISSLEATDATYEWVADKAGTPTEPKNTFDTSKTGFNWGYIKMADKKKPEISTVIPVPITVTNEVNTIVEKKVAFGTTRGMNIIKQSEISGNDPTQLNNILKDKLKINAWDLTTGADVPIEITDLGGLTGESTVGVYELTFSMTLPDNSVKTAKRAYTLLSDEIFAGTSGASTNNMSRSAFDDIFGNSLDGWTSIPLNEKAIITNPINGSQISFPKRGLTVAGPGATVQQGFIVKDASEVAYVHNNAKVSTIPFVNGQAVYPNDINGLIGSHAADRVMGIGYGILDAMFESQYYLKKGNELKQILVDQKNQLIYVYDIKLSRNLNFSINLSMYNTASTTRNLAMLENVDTNYYNDKVALYALGDNNGFYMKPQAGKQFAIKLKDSSGAYLSDYTMFAAGAYGSWVGNYPDVPMNLSSLNWFNHDFSRAGIEQYNYPKDHVILNYVDSAYQLGAPYRPVATNQALRAGYEVFAGTELPYMRLSSNPKDWNVYADYNGGDFVTDYTLASIPSIGGFGTLYVTYPNQQEHKIPFIADGNKESNGRLTIPRATLPTVLNDESGTIKSYTTGMLGVYESNDKLKSLTSNDYSMAINVYSIGASPIAQTVQRNSAWTKAASALVKDPVILPGHTAIYEYVGAQVDTSKLGIQTIQVKMTDKEEPTQSKIINVPVNVVDGTAPTTGLSIVADDFSLAKGDLTGLSAEDIKKLILKESKAVGWDNATGLSTGVTVSVKTTDLTTSASPGNQYKATIQAVKGSVTAEKTITITITSEFSAKAVPQTVPLGADESYWKDALLKATVNEVKNGSSTISNYNVSLVTAPVTNRITTSSSMTVKVTNAANSSQSMEVNVPVNVTWGNSIALGGSGTNITDLGQSSLAFTLQEDQSGRPYIRSAYGNLPQANTNTPFVNASATGAYFFQFTRIDMSSQATGQAKAKEVTNGTSSGSALQALGARTPAQVINDLGTNGKLDVNYGDVLKLYVQGGQHVLYTANQGPEQPMKELSNMETLFVVVTKNGFTPLYFNQLTAKEVEIATESTATNALYAAHYNSMTNYFTIPSGSTSNYARIQPNGFKTYPKLNLAVGEKAAGSVLVTEPTSTTSNQYLQLSYNLTFVGSGPDLQIVTPLASLSFGTQTIKSYSQEIKRTDPNWGFTVLDSRQIKSAWVIQAKMSEPFKTSGANAKQLKGAELKAKQASSTVSLNSGFQTVYTKNNPEASNSVTWTSDKGFFLQVPPGVIDKDAAYSTEVEFLLTNAP